MGDDNGMEIIFGLGVIFGGVVGVIGGCGATNSSWRAECISNGLAMYSPDTAEFVLFKADEIARAPQAADEPEPAEAGEEQQ